MHVQKQISYLGIGVRSGTNLTPLDWGHKTFWPSNKSNPFQYISLWIFYSVVLQITFVFYSPIRESSVKETIVVSSWCQDNASKTKYQIEMSLRRFPSIPVQMVVSCIDVQSRLFYRNPKF